MTAQEGRAENRGPLTLRLTLPPSTNKLTRNTSAKERKVFHTKASRKRTAEYNAWLNDTGWLIRAQSTPPRLIAGPNYRVTIRLNTRVRGDISNRIKAVEDALVKNGVMVDDRFVFTLHVERWGYVPAGTCVVIVQTEPEPNR